MTLDQKNLIKSTIPILRTNGIALTKYFYKRMFEHNPELQSVFNMGNQANGKQQTALAYAVLAYAEHIDNPSVLISALQNIGQKHVSLNIKPEQYQIVGRHLIASISEVLGTGASKELLDAWTQAYFELARIMIDLEQQMYNQNLTKTGGWIGWRAFEIRIIETTSSEIKSFYLYPVDGKPIASFLAGQFISIQIEIPDLNILQPRQYSLSSVYHPDYYRISIKKEYAENALGMVSNAMHLKQQGDIVLLSSPMGTFNVDLENKNPLVLISGGVGITPLYSMLQANQQNQQNKTIFIHGCRNIDVQAFKNELSQLQLHASWLQTYFFYESILGTETNINTFQGRIDLSICKEAILLENAQYYICGPEQFITHHYNHLIQLKVNKNQIFFEQFGPQTISF
ncbi:NO-inducible flavohemoprotein [Flavobacterium branchiophilum]|uniref:nitric oxide dioxygenase n=2 Tax=Flavobacterium branchiophilum TaxID=55197 RepID=G2Z488_FLABF|nr:NO-inducible flavohemoprotein [Flavobacterium branchiophilum]PDS22069.1 NO-inducible flavohemoprotein [Flavobacterium branchiophilum]CCB70577.1 Nitric oxide dioxygenase [Flavobacterium branchiophilum FL-15]